MIKAVRFLVPVGIIVLLSGCNPISGQFAQAGDPVTLPTTAASTLVTKDVPATDTSHASLTVSGTDGSNSELDPERTDADAEPSPTSSPTPTATPFLCPYLHGRTETGMLDSQAMGEQVRYLVHLPPCYDQFPTKAFPTLYLFHGWPMNEWHWYNLGMATSSDDWVSRGIAGPFVLVMPGVHSDGRYVHSSGGDSSFEGFVVNELVPYIDSTYRTIGEPWGRSLGGISRGGVWSLEIAMRHPDLFGAAGGHSPALALNQPLPAYDPFLLARGDISGLRFYLDAGDADWSRSGALRLHDLLQEVGADVTYDLHTGGHVDDLWRGGIPDYLAFYTRDWPASYSDLPEWGDTN